MRRARRGHPADGSVLAIDRPEVAEVIEGSRRIVTDLRARAWLDRLDKILGLRRSGARAARPGAVALSMPAAERDPR